MCELGGRVCQNQIHNWCLCYMVSEFWSKMKSLSALTANHIISLYPAQQQSPVRRARDVAGYGCSFMLGFANPRLRYGFYKLGRCRPFGRFSFISVLSNLVNLYFLSDWPEKTSHQCLPYDDFLIGRKFPNFDFS